MIAGILIAAACIPIDGNIPGFSTVTPTIQGDHDYADTVLIRVYAKRPEDTSWPWVQDLPYLNDPDYGVFGPGINFGWPIQRVIPCSVSYEEVQFVMKAVDADNNESAPSNVLTLCPPLCMENP